MGATFFRRSPCRTHVWPHYARIACSPYCMRRAILAGAAGRLPLDLHFCCSAYHGGQPVSGPEPHHREDEVCCHRWVGQYTKHNNQENEEQNLWASACPYFSPGPSPTPGLVLLSHLPIPRTHPGGQVKTGTGSRDATDPVAANHRRGLSHTIFHLVVAQSIRLGVVRAARHPPPPPQPHADLTSGAVDPTCQLLPLPDSMWGRWRGGGGGKWELGAFFFARNRTPKIQKARVAAPRALLLF